MQVPPTGAFLLLFAMAPFILLGIYRALYGGFPLVQYLWFRQRASADATPGPTITRGTPTALEDSIEAPYSKEDCFAYRYTVEEYDNHNQNNYWDQVRVGQDGTPIVLEDASGRIVVDPSKADMRLSQTYKADVERDESAPDPGDADTSEIVGHLGISHGTHRYTEYRLDPDDEVLVVGRAERTAPGEVRIPPDPGERGPLERRTQPEWPFVVSDGDGWRAFGPELRTSVGWLFFTALIVSFCIAVWVGTT